MSDSGLARDGRFGRAYDERAFRHFIRVERARAERRGSGLRVLLARLGPPPRGGAGREAAGDRMLDALLQAVRDTDIVGWFREGVVAGAILGDRAWASEESADAAVARAGAAFRRALPVELDGRVRIRVARVVRTQGAGGPR